MTDYNYDVQKLFLEMMMHDAQNPKNLLNKLDDELSGNTTQPEMNGGGKLESQKES